jgi:hypothetical protein
VAADVTRVLAVLSALLADVAEKAETPAAAAALQAMVAASYPDVAALQLAWRGASPQPIEAPVRMRPGSLADIPSSGRLPPHDSPLALSIRNEAPRETENSMIGYLRSGGVPSLRPVAPRERAVMYDPLSKVAEVSRLVQATSHVVEPEARSSKGRGWRGVAMASGAVAGAAVLVLASGSRSALDAPELQAPPHVTGVRVVTPSPTDAAVEILELEAPDASADTSGTSGSAAATAPSSGEELELTAMLRTTNAPPNRDVFIDGVSVGKTPLETSVPCGRHMLQMVAGATKLPIELPCGGQRVISYDASGRWNVK